MGEGVRPRTAIVVAVDGPAGSGKSTLSRRLASELGLPYVNTGLMYRAVARRALLEGVDPEDGASLARLARRITFELDRTSSPPALRIDGRPPDESLTSAGVESIVSRTSRHRAVRDLMHDQQRRLGRAGAVMEGRDIGSVVFPNATLRVRLEAGAQERAARRAGEREGTTVREVEQALAARDRSDARNVPPLESDVEIDTNGLDADAVFEIVLAAVRERIGDGG